MVDRNTLKSALGVTPDCLSPEQLAKLTADEVNGHTHLLNCARCQTELDLMREFESSKPLPGEGAAVAWISSQLEHRLDEIKNPARAAQSRRAGVPAERSSWFLRLISIPGFQVIAPMAAALAIVGSLLLLRSPKEPELQANLGGDTAVYRSQEVQILAPQGELTKAPSMLQWKSVTGAAVYKVVITEVDQTEVWSAQTNDTFMTIPVSVIGKMRVGKPFVWKVAALDPQGVVLASSQAQRFVVMSK